MKLLAALVLISFGVVAPVFAQAPAAPSQAKSTLPPLPPSRPCKQEDIYGGWKLIRLMEDPSGGETAGLASAPTQYLSFYDNNTYQRHLNTINPPAEEVRQIMLYDFTGGLLQYVVNDKGYLYLYKDSVATASWACFIVANSTADFSAGHMLLLPPKSEAKGRLIKVYSHEWTDPSPRGKRNNNSNEEE